MSNEFPKFSEVFALDKAVTYNEAVSQVWYPQDNAIVSVPSVSPIETVTLEENKIIPTVALVQISYNIVSDKILNFIDYSNLRDGAILQLRIQDNTFPITIKNGITGNGSIMTADGNDIVLDDYRQILQFQREGDVWRQVVGTQTVVSLKDQQDVANPKKLWTGSKEQYEAIAVKDPTVIYGVQEDGIYLGEIPLTGGGGLEIGDIGFAPLGIDETQNKRRYLNGQVIIQEQFESFTNKIKKAVEFYPSLATSETNWQAEVTNSKLGQCGKFVINDTAGTIRLPKVVNIQGLQDLALMGNIKAESLPNIKGNFRTAEFGWDPTGVFKRETTAAGSPASGSNSGLDWINFNASRASSAYQDNAPVQQEAIQYPYFIQVATGVEESVDVTREIELNNPFFFGMSQYFEVEPNNISWIKSAGQWNSKAIYTDYYDWILANVNGGVEGFALSTATYTDYDFVINTADETFRLPLLDGSESLPSNRYEELTILSSGSKYTAPANGYFCARGSIAGSFVSIYNPNTWIANCGDFLQNIDTGHATCPVKRGDEVQFTYNSTPLNFRFIYAQGNGSLYFYVGETIQDANIIASSNALTEITNIKGDLLEIETNLTKDINNLPKHVVVSSLPSTRDANTFYYIPE